jgi:DNA repair exonuclease SbcCD ATPase subunit
MLTFKTLKLRNFLSYGNAETVLELDHKGITKISGNNLDSTSSGNGANGTGKTVIINAIAFALYDKTVSNIKSKDFLVNNVNNQDMMVSLAFDKGSDEYEITRVRKGKTIQPKGSWVRLIKNGEDITPDSIQKTNDALESIIGMPFDLFVRGIIFSAMQLPFLDLPAKQAVNVIENLFGFTELTERGDKLRPIIKETQREFDMLEVKIQQQEAEQARHKQLCESTEQRVIDWSVQNESSIAKCRNDIADLSDIDIDFDAEMQKFADRDKLTEEYNTTTAIKQELTKEVNSLESKQQSIKRSIAKLDDELTHLSDSTCPYCQQHMTDADDKIEEIKQTIESKQEELSECGDDLIADLKAMIDEKVSELESLMNDIQSIKDSLIARS